MNDIEHDENVAKDGGESKIEKGGRVVDGIH